MKWRIGSLRKWFGYGDALAPITAIHKRRALSAPEVLESRLAPAVIAWVNEGLLRIAGDASNDQICVRQKAGNISVDGTLIRVANSAQLSVPVASVTRIVVEGKGGNDLISLQSQSVAGQQSISIPALLFGGVGDDVIVGGEGKDVLAGGEGNDRLYGGGGDDYLFGGGGDDQLTGDAGWDLAGGGRGSDTFARTNVEGVTDLNSAEADSLVGPFPAPPPMPVTPAQPPFGSPLPIPVNPQMRVVFDSSVLFVDGTEGVDEIQFVRDSSGMVRTSNGQQIETPEGLKDAVSPNDMYLTVGFGNNGNDTLNFAQLLSPSIIFGGNGDDLLLGSSGQNYSLIYGGAGNDTIFAGTGIGAMLYGGSGNDLLLGQGSSDMLFGEAGDDTLRGNGGNDRLEGGDGNDTLYGGDGGDILLGGYGDDTLDGGTGANQLDGGFGTDTAIAPNSQDSVTGVEVRRNR